jgi:ABC-type dipeptide/oligopeptide/nickel transport system permease component
MTFPPNSGHGEREDRTLYLEESDEKSKEQIQSRVQVGSHCAVQSAGCQHRPGRARFRVARYARFVRSSMLEVISSDYIRTAHAKGLSQRHITIRHALKNAALPVIALITIDIPFILSGAVVTESIFSWPGMGHLFIESLSTLDPPLLMIFVIMTAIAVVLSQLFADVAYAWADPRIRYE